MEKKSNKGKIIAIICYAVLFTVIIVAAINLVKSNKITYEMSQITEIETIDTEGYRTGTMVTYEVKIKQRDGNACVIEVPATKLLNIEYVKTNDYTVTLVECYGSVSDIIIEYTDVLYQYKTVSFDYEGDVCMFRYSEISNDITIRVIYIYDNELNNTIKV